MKAIEIIAAAYDTMTAENPRSAWNKGVKEYALELLEDLETAVNDGYVTIEDLTDRNRLKEKLLNGAANWNEYSWGGSALIYNCDIARRLCAPWELRKTHDGEKNPNPREEWLDTQARALYQASRMVLRAINSELCGKELLK